MLHLKTDDELRFFVENPSYYQPELVAAAKQELRRRYPTPAAPPAPVSPAVAPPATEAPRFPKTDYDGAPARRASSWLLPASVAAVLLLAGVGFWHKASQHQPAAHAPRPAQAVAAAPAPPPLETAIAAPPLPTYDAETYVEQALTRVPAAEKANQQRLAQYQAISRRFWAAQQPSAYLVGQVQRHQLNPVFGKQAALVLDLWQEFDRALIYSYDFEPVMNEQFKCMQAIARLQRASLTELAATASANQPLHLIDAQLIAGQQSLPQLLAPLQPKSNSKKY